ncbi:MAG TPA: S53 family peptidase [Solirubrobacteraceae bacterium]|nr:S53 family peptidase [Solirubrobacteraceae bacterium]
MFRRSAGSLVFALLALLVAATAASAARAPRIWFPNNRLPLAHATRLGAASSSQRMEVGVGLKDPHPAAEQKLMAAQQNPASPQYHHFLTPAQYDKRFAVSKTTFQHTLSWLRGGGATVLDTSGARDFVEISATTSQLDQLFQTTIGSYEAQGVHFLANASAPSVPAGLHILTVMGLNTLIHPTTPLSGATAADRAPGSSLLGKSTDPTALKSIAGEGSLVNSISSSLGVAGILGKTAAGAPTIPASLTPQQLWSVYDMPSANTGQGQSVAVMGAGDSSTTVKDLALFEQEMKLPQVPVKVTDIPKDGDFSDTGGNVEWELDTQASTGMAPNVKQVHLYFAQHLVDPDAEADFAKWVDDKNGPKQANASFGECETTPANATLESTIPAQFNNNQDQNALYGTGAPNALEPVADQTLRQGVLEGRTLFAATGDTGSSCPVLVLGPEAGAGNGVANQGVPIVNYPAASPYVVAVGGTVLYPDSDNTRGLEYPWPYTGGGQSFFIPAPSFQSGVSGIDRPCLSDVNGNPNTSGVTCRGIPDVADESGDIATSSYDIYSDELGGESGEGGTSLSSPLMMGMWARVQAAAKGGTGFADPLIYAVGKNATEDAADFNDYEVGTNGAYQALPGWDYVSGWGTPNLTPLMKDVDHGRTAPIQAG